MGALDAEQPALEGLAPRAKRSRTAGTPLAAELPIAQVVLDVQSPHLGQTFDYQVPERHDAAAQPGALVRVRFGGQRVNGVIWARVAHSDAPSSSLRCIERVLSQGDAVPAQLRRDIEAIADAYGGTRANVVRVAVPPRVARVEEEQRHKRERQLDSQQSAQAHEREQAAYAVMHSWYADAGQLRESLRHPHGQSYVVDGMPAARDVTYAIAWMVLCTWLAGGSIVVVLPDVREVQDVANTLSAWGMHPFAMASAHTYGVYGDVATYGAMMSPAERYRVYHAVRSGQVRCVVGVRSAMYAPVGDGANFVVVDDTVYQHADGMAPYAQARGVMRLRARLHHGTFIAFAQTRSVASQWEVDERATHTAVSSPSVLLRPLTDVLRDATPWVRWLNREELGRIGDRTAGARVPHTAVSILTKALEHGPVLLSVPSDGVRETMSCASCHRQARCLRCTGPVLRIGEQEVRCGWCAAAQVHWRCVSCGGERLRVVRVGPAGTAMELQGLFRRVPIVVSGTQQGRRAVPWVENRPMVVVASSGVEPRVRAADGSWGQYRAVALLDAWTSLYATGVDARYDVLRSWMRVASWCAPRSKGGQALIVGEADPVVAQSLALWDSGYMTAAELRERVDTGLSPVVSVACVWGQRDAVMRALRELGVLDGDWAEVCVGERRMPAVLGPVPIAPPRTQDARELEATRDRVKAVVRVEHKRREALARALRQQMAWHAGTREPGELRFQMDPKDMM